MKIKHTALLALATVCASASTSTFAASQNECAIWLCLPGGFPVGCGAAYSAMLHRIKHGHLPLPSFSSCTAKDEYSNPNDFSYSYRSVLKMRYGSGYYYVPGFSCVIKHGGRDGDKYRIKGCISPMREIKIFEQGKLLGKPYRW